MKKNLLFLVMLAFSLAVFTACGDDDEVNTPLANEIVGVYAGEMDVFLVTDPPILVVGKLAKDITITKKGDNAVDMELKNLEIPLAPDTPALSLGDIKMENCLVTGTKEKVQFTQTADLYILYVGECNVSVAGTVVNGKINMDIDVAVNSGDLNVKVVYGGTKK